MKPWKERRKIGATTNNMPTETDQSSANSTDLNVIIRQFAITGRAPGAPTEPLYGDFTNLPTDLRGYIEESRNIHKIRRNLPEQLRNLPIEQLLTLTPQQLTTILTPPKQETTNATRTTEGNQTST